MIIYILDKEIPCFFFTLRMDPRRAQRTVTPGVPMIHHWYVKIAL